MSETGHKNYAWVIAAMWLAALAAAFACDRPVAEWIRSNVPVDKKAHITHIVLQFVKLPGYFPVTLVIAALLAIFHREHLRAASALTVNGIVVGTLYSVIKWIAGRHRPDHGIDPSSFHLCPQGIPGLWREKALCFPSGHASLSFVTASTLMVLLPRWTPLFFAIACIVAGERIIENAHYLSDVVAGAGMGTLVGWLLTRKIAPETPEPRGFEVLPTTAMSSPVDVQK